MADLEQQRFTAFRVPLEKTFARIFNEYKEKYGNLEHGKNYPNIDASHFIKTMYYKIQKIKEPKDRLAIITKFAGERLGVVEEFMRHLMLFREKSKELSLMELVSRLERDVLYLSDFSELGNVQKDIQNLLVKEFKLGNFRNAQFYFKILWQLEHAYKAVIELAEKRRGSI